MREHHVGCVVVTEETAKGRSPVGMLTDRDLVVGLVAVDVSYLERAVVRDLMQRRVISVDVNDSLYQVVRVMRSYGVRRVPVVNGDGVLQGIIALDDLIDHMAEELTLFADLLRREGERERKLRPSPGAAQGKR
jgi:CBS domain-containing protein